MIAVKEYKEKYLEFWRQNINLTKDIINGSIDKLEIYGLHCFRIHGSYPALAVYFRSMSLEKLIKVKVLFYRRPIGEIINSIIRAGFIIEKVLEPMPTEQFKISAPEKYDRLTKKLQFLFIRVRKE